MFWKIVLRSSYEPCVRSVLWLVGIECANCDGPDLQKCLSQCDATTLVSVRAAVVDGLAQLQEKSDLVEEALTGIDML